MLMQSRLSQRQGASLSSSSRLLCFSRLKGYGNSLLLIREEVGFIFLSVTSK
jgi:hypothetical protein